MQIEEYLKQVLTDSVPEKKTCWFEWACLKAYLIENPELLSRHI